MSFGGTMKRPHFIHVISTILLFSASLTAGERPTYLFLQNDVSARASAMAGSFVSMQGDAAGLFYNPATISTLTSPVASIGYTGHVLDIKSGFAAYVQNFEDIGVVGFGVNYINYGTFNGMNDQGISTGSFGAGDMAMSLTLANPFEQDLYYGVTAKYIYSSIADANSSGLGMDLGVMYVIPGDDQITLGTS